MRLLRAGPERSLVALDLDDGAARSHAGMRLERPFVFGLAHTCSVLEGLLDVAGRLAFDLLLARRRLAEVIVEVGHVLERWLDVRPFDLELFGGLDRVPFLVGYDAEEAFVPHHLGARN